MAASDTFLGKLIRAYNGLPEFVTEDLLEGLLVGGGMALPVAMMPNQDPSEQAAALLGGIGAATLGGAASRHIGAAIGGRIHPGAVREQGFGYNMGRSMGRKNLAKETMADMLGLQAAPTITGEEIGRAAGRMIGDEVFGLAGTIGAVAAAQQMDSTPDEQPQPTIGQIALGTVPGAALGLLGSGLGAGMVDVVGMNRAMFELDPKINNFANFTPFARKGKPGATP